MLQLRGVTAGYGDAMVRRMWVSASRRRRWSGTGPSVGNSSRLGLRLIQERIRHSAP
jgi:hypothetical protein